MKKRLLAFALLLCMIFTLFPMQAFAEGDDVSFEETVLDEPVALEAVDADAVVEESAQEEVFIKETSSEESVEQESVADSGVVDAGDTIMSEETVIEEIAAAEEPDDEPAANEFPEENTVFEESSAEDAFDLSDATDAPEFELEVSGTDTPLRGDTPITSVKVTVTPPVAGQNPVNVAIVPNDTNYQAPLVKWLDANDNQVKKDEVFVAGQTYYVYVMVQPCIGYSFPNIPAVCKINDHNNCGYSVDMYNGKNVLILSTSFVAKDVIDTARILLTKPKAGDMPDYSASIPFGVNYETGPYTNGSYKNDVIWYDETTRSFLTPDQDVFQAGHQYNVRVNLLAKSGYVFSDDAVGRINGYLAEFYNYPNGMVNTDGVPVGAFEYTFPMLLFSDVTDASTYYYTAVYWAAGQGITSGTSATDFSPGKDCTRGQIVTFLWKAMGSPEPSSTSNPFTDVKASDYFYKPVLWAKEKGITSGTTATTFSPGKPCTRGQIVTFLWKAMGSPEPSSTSNPFTDVKTSDYFFKAVLWAREKGITSGTTATTFSPGKTCTRAQAMTFLWNAKGKPSA